MEHPERKEDLELKTEVLTKRADLSSFDCGRPALNEWLEKYGWSSQQSGTAKTYIIWDGDQIAGFYSICPAEITYEQVVVRMKKGQPKGRSIPVIKIACLAVSKDYQGIGLGSAMLKEALLKCLSAADIISGRAVIVDAIDDGAVSFYEQFDFVSSPANKRLMMLMIKDLKKTYEEVFS